MSRGRPIAALVAVAALVFLGWTTTTTRRAYAYDGTAHSAPTRAFIASHSAESVASWTLHPSGVMTPASPSTRVVVATEGVGEEAGSVAFRSDTSHIFRDATGHFLDDTAANRSVIQGAIDPANLRSTITLPDGSTLARYFQTLPDGTQAWVEVRNGVEITNGGLNATPR